MEATRWNIAEAAADSGPTEHRHDGPEPAPVPSRAPEERHYTCAELERPILSHRMQALGFSVSETHAILHLLDRLTGPGPGPAPMDRRTLLDGLIKFREAGESRCGRLREQLVEATDFVCQRHSNFDPLTAGEF
jgi:hypothetical protein